MWADHMPDFVLKVLKDTFQKLKNNEGSTNISTPACRQQHHGLQRCLSDNGSCYISVLDSPTGTPHFLRFDCGRNLKTLT